MALLSRAVYEPAPGQPTPDGNPEEHRKVFTNGISKELRREKRRDLQLRSSSIAAVYGLRLSHQEQIMTLNTIMSIVSVTTLKLKLK